MTIKRRFCYLPDEVAEDILLRLPSESLVRFKCVCESWCALVSHPSFVEKHLHINNKRSSSSTSLLLSWMQDGNDIVNFEQQRCLVIISNADAVNDNSNHIPSGIESLDLSVIPDIDNATFLRGSHCNGIISLTEISGSSKNSVILYNPSLREFKILPGCVINRFSLRAEGFGYDSRANDYKFVRILNSFVTYECIAMVYNMISDSWRRIKIDIEGIINVTHRGRVYCKGVYYWWVLNRLDFNDVILSFDMSSEEFDIIPLPENVQEVNESSKILAVWNESVVCYSVLKERGCLYHLKSGL